MAFFFNFYSSYLQLNAFSDDYSLINKKGYRKLISGTFYLGEMKNATSIVTDDSVIFFSINLNIDQKRLVVYAFNNNYFENVDRNVLHNIHPYLVIYGLLQNKSNLQTISKDQYCSTEG